MKVCDVSEYPLDLASIAAENGCGTDSSRPEKGSSPKNGGRYLIEASAGTGKTYTITHLILRLILKGVPVQRILVTTFSKAAADELKTRILALLNNELNQLETDGRRESGSTGGQTDSEAKTHTGEGKPGSDSDSRQPALFEYAGNQKKRFLLQLAVSSIDEMTVSTIHGFCQKMLRDFALKSGSGFETELVPDESDYRDRLIREFCRNRFYGGESKLAEKFKTLQDSAAFASEPIGRDSADGESLTQRQELCRDVYRYVKKNIQTRKDKDGVMSYEDIIRNFDAALQKDDALAEMVRSRYDAVFVDEFQDTDRLQYRIFDRCFPKGSPKLFYMIGDPKQAIYGFRGADIYTYLEAKKTADDQFTLTRNYRSSPAMIEAVNRMFSDGNLEETHETNGVFLQKDIPFISIAGNASGNFPEPQGGSLRLRHYTGKKGECAAVIHRDVVREIRYLLSEDCMMQVAEKQDGCDGGNGLRRLRASDIAILVQNHDQAAQFVKQLNAEGIAASACKSGKIYSSTEAKLMLLLLRCFLHPDMKSVRGLMLSPFFRFSGDDVISNSAYAETLLKQMTEYGKIWTQSGLPAAFLQFLDTPLFDGGVSPRMRILSEFNGERVITNFIQLMELLYQKESKERLLPEDLFNNLNLIINDKVKSNSESESEDNPDQLRLDRDSASVQILTMFAAKGLEFPVVFVPFPAKTDWNHMQRDKIAFRFNSAARNDETPEVILDFGRTDESLFIARQEEIRNSLRLLYVALTRASLVTYLYTQQLSGPSSSAINFAKSAQGILLTSHRQSAEDAGKTVVEHLWDSGYFSGTKDILPKDLAEWWNNLDDRGNVGDRAFRVTRDGVFERHFGERTGIGPLRKDEAQGNPVAAVFSGGIRDGWSIMSFSAFHNKLNDRADTERETPADLDEQNDALQDEEGTGMSAETAGSSTDLNLFRGFPRGTTVGSMTHKLLENLAGRFNLFASGRQDDPENRMFIHGKIEDVFREFGYDPEDGARKDQVLDGVTRTLQIPLPKTVDGSGIGISLSEIRQEKMVPEMEFFLDAPDSLNLEMILSILADDASEQAKQLVDRKKVAFDGNGVLNGIVDLVFEHEHKYYIVDWKTNWLGGSDADYTPGRIRAAMGNAGYVLQSYLYSAALYRFLLQRGMDYGSFGGVYYIFLRGLTRGTRNGIWFDVPPLKCLERLLTHFNKENGE